MSEVIHQTLNAFATEVDRVRNAAEAIRDSAVLATSGIMSTFASPNSSGIVDAYNTVKDPEHLGGGVDWVVLNGTKEVTDTFVPQGFRRAVCGVASGGAQIEVHAQFTPEHTALHYGYVLLRTNYPHALEVRFAKAGTLYTAYPVTALLATDQWYMVRLQENLVAGTEYWIRVSTTGSPVSAAGERVWVTGATAVSSVDTTRPVVYSDPGQPFSGDTPADENFAFSWEAAQGASRSRRHTRALDVLALRELEHGLSTGPSQLSLAERQAYVLSRFQGRGRPYGTTFVDKIVDVIKSTDSSFTASSVQVVENHENFSMTVIINFDAGSVLAARIEALVDAITPAHLAVDVQYASFLADIDTAGEAV